MEQRGAPTERGDPNWVIRQRNQEGQKARALKTEVATIKAEIRRAETQREFTAAQAQTILAPLAFPGSPLPWFLTG